MRLMAFDLAGRIGYAIGDTEDTKGVLYGAHTLPTTGADIARYIDDFLSWLGKDDFLRRFEPIPDIVIFEAPVLPRQTKLITVRKLASLATMLEWRCLVACMQCREVDLQSVKKFWAGKGNAKKHEMTAAARAYGYQGISDEYHQDEADALAIWWFAAAQLSESAAADFRKRS